MPSLKQYTDLFRQERTAIDSNATEALNAGRDRAMESWKLPGGCRRSQTRGMRRPPSKRCSPPTWG